jgi:hypothetical protein
MTERDDGPQRADIDPCTPVTSVPEEPQSAPAPEEEPLSFVPSRGGCRTDLRGWAGAHLHGAVRPRRRAVSRGRPPGRWC